jgi:hypothetical protein
MWVMMCVMMQRKEEKIPLFCKFPLFLLFNLLLGFSILRFPGWLLLNLNSMYPQRKEKVLMEYWRATKETSEIWLEQWSWISPIGGLGL